MSRMTIENLTKLRDTAPNQKLKRQYEMMLDKLVKKAQQNEPKEALETQNEVVQEPKIEPEPAIFQAIGAISGRVSLTEEEHLVIDIRGHQFDLRYIPGRSWWSYSALKQEVKNNGEGEFIIRCYPQARHYPDRDRPYSMFFVPLQFERVNAEERRLTDPIGLFKLSGFWQFIPCCKTPVVSVFRNGTKDLHNQLKTIDNPVKARNLTRVQHLPLMWRDGATPFRFNPQTEKQDTRFFIQVEATFDPKGKRFFFKEQIADPTLDAPRYRKPIKPQVNKD